jgi:hypothetical protein
MKKLLFSMIVLPFTLCATFENSFIPKQSSPDSAAFAVKVTSDHPILQIYFSTGNKFVRSSHLGNYYVVFNAKPGDYTIAEGVGLEQRHEFPKEMKQLATVSVNKGEFKFIGAFSIKTDYFVSLDDYDPTQEGTIPSFSYESKRTTYYYKVPDVENAATAKQDFVNYMTGRLKGTAWDTMIK